MAWYTSPRNLLALALPFAAVSLLASRKPREEGLSDVALSRVASEHAPRTRFEVSFLFRAADCELTSALADSLQAVAASLGATLHYVLLDPPPDTTDAHRIMAELGAQTPVHFDYDRRWKTALATDHAQAPLVVITGDDAVLGVFTPHKSAMVARLAGAIAY